MQFYGWILFGLFLSSLSLLFTSLSLSFHHCLPPISPSAFIYSPYFSSFSSSPLSIALLIIVPFHFHYHCPFHFQVGEGSVSVPCLDELKADLSFPCFVQDNIRLRCYGCIRKTIHNYYEGANHFLFLLHSLFCAFC